MGDLIPLDHDHDATRVWLVPVLKKKESLPGAECHLPIHHRDHFACPGESHANMRGHVIRPLVSVHKVRSVLGNEMIKKGMQVGPRARIGILHDDQTCAGVPDKDGCCSRRNSRFSNDVLNLAGDLVSSFSGRADGKAGSMTRHARDPDTLVAGRSSHPIAEIKDRVLEPGLEPYFLEG